MLTSMTVRATLIAIACVMSLSAHAMADPPRQVDIPAGDLRQALLQASELFGTDLVYETELLKGLRTKGVSGNFSAQEAVTKLLEGTPLQLRTDEASGAILITTPTPSGPATSSLASGSGAGARLAQAEPTNPSPGTGEGKGEASKSSKEDEETSYKNQELPAPEEAGRAIPEVLVEGSKILNTDIPRSRDDPQPYVIFDKEIIEQSGAANVEDFLKQRLTMNTTGVTSAQFRGSTTGNASAINLRGLGAGQTLVLVDGRRLSGFGRGSGVDQPPLNGIPLAAIERIEVLPTTASGIYGGGATGGVINIIRRRDFSGMDVNISYENTFDSNTPTRRVDLASGLSLEGGKTNLLLAMSLADRDVLEVRDRKFVQHGQASILANDPSVFFSPGNPSSKPLGATTNISSADGSNLILRNGTALNSPYTYVPAGYAGPASDGGAALVAGASAYNFDLADSAQATGNGQSLLVGPETESIALTVRREFSSRIHAFLDIWGSNESSQFPTSGGGFGAITIPANVPTNPFQQAINVRVPSSFADSALQSSTNDRRATGGVIIQLPHEWKAEADFTWHQYKLDYQGAPSAARASTAVANGAVDVIRDPSAYLSSLVPYVDSVPSFRSSPMRSTLRDIALRVGGPFGSLPGGAPQLSVLVERVESRFDEATETSSAGTIALFPDRSQVVESLYLEARLPLVSERNRVPGVRALELQLAGRRDEYETQGSATVVFGPPFPPILRATNSFVSNDPSFALLYQPLQDITLRASFGTGFLPPSVVQVTPTLGQNATISDPRRGNTTYAVVGTVTTGGNPDLKPESSESWSAGAIFTPRFAPGLRLSLDYTHIEKVDNIAAFPGGTQALVENENLFPERITRGTAPPGDPFGVGPIIAINRSLFNIAQAEVDAWDAQLDYRFDLASAGSLGFFAIATYQPHFKTQLLVGQPTIEQAGYTNSNPLKIKANAGLTWNYRQLALGWSAVHFDSYFVYGPTSSASSVAAAIRKQGSSKVPSQTYHDAFAAYTFATTEASWLSNTEIRLGVRNIFNESPPFDSTNLDAYYSPFGDPRLSSYQVSLKKTF